MMPQRAFETRLRTTREKATEKKKFLEEMHRSLFAGVMAMAAKQTGMPP